MAVVASSLDAWLERYGVEALRGDPGALEQALAVVAADPARARVLVGRHRRWRASVDPTTPSPGSDAHLSEGALVERALRMAAAAQLGDGAAWDEHFGYLDALVVQEPPADPEPVALIELAARAARRRATPGAPDRWALRSARAWRAASALPGSSGGAAEALAAVAAGGPLLVGGFDLGRELGSGSMGVVYEGVHHVVGAPVALKVLTAEAARHPRRVRLIEEEIRTLAVLDHPGIVHIVDHGTVDRAAELTSGGRLVQGSPYLVMERVSGTSLQALAGRLPWPRARGVLLQLLRALAYAHARDVVHLDLKPENLVWDEGRQRLVLLDFGIARTLGDGRGQRRVAGTPTMMAPEQWRGQWWLFGPWTDLYAVGCLATTLLTGHPPFEVESVEAFRRAHEHEEPAPVEVSDGPRGLDQWVRRLLAKDPAERYRLAAEAAMALELLDDDADEETTLSVEDETVRAPLSAWRPPRIVELATHAAPELILEAAAHLAPIRARPFRGRARELGALRARFEQVGRRRVCHGTVVVGPPGSGTTRLAAELQQLLHETGAAWLIQARPGEREPRQVLTRLFGLDHAPTLAVEQRVWEVSSAFGIRDEPLIRELAAALRTDGPLGELSRRLLTHMARLRPGMVLVEDPEVSRVWGELLPLVGVSAPLLLVATTHQPPLPVRGVEVTTLGPLARAACASVVRDAVPVAEDLADAICAWAQDLPGPALERVRALLDGRRLWFHEDRYRLRPGATLLDGRGRDPVDR